MNKRTSGALTIEAAIVLPLVIIVFVSILFFAKVFYIQDQVHSALTKGAHDLAVDTYVIDQLGLVEMQQSLYADGASGLADINTAAQAVSQNAETLMITATGIVDYGNDVGNWFDGISDYQWGNDFGQVMDTAIRLMEEGPSLASSVCTNMTDMIEALTDLYDAGKSNLPSVALMEAIDYSNGLVAGKVAETAFYKYISEDQLVAWGVSSDNGTVDLSMSSLMLYDDRVELVAVYGIEIPFGQDWFGESIPIFQKVTVRSWTGSYDSNENKAKPENKAEEAEEIFYITTDKDGNPDDTDKAYHYYNCLVSPLTQSIYEDVVDEDKGNLCKYCYDHYYVEGKMEGTTVYLTKTGKKIHLEEKCPRIHSAYVKAVTEEEAISEGKHACGSPGCVAWTRAKKKEEEEE